MWKEKKEKLAELGIAAAENLWQRQDKLIIEVRKITIFIRRCV